MNGQRLSLTAHYSDFADVQKRIRVIRVIRG
jgi:hypothetical protein